MFRRAFMHVSLGVFGVMLFVRATTGAQTFRDASDRLPVTSPDGVLLFGASAIDVNSDGLVDLYHHQRLYIQRPDGTFQLDPEAFGQTPDGLTREGEAVFGAIFGDFDNDGWQDLVVGNEVGNILHLYRNRGDYTFARVNVGEVAAEARGTLAAADVNDDGWVDLYTPALGREWLWLNEGGTNHWLKVEARGKAANHFGVGARVEVYARALHQIREITAGDGMTSQNHALTAHFGLGMAARVDSLVVRWPHGVADRVFDLAADQSVTVVEGLGRNQPPSRFALEQPADESAVSVSDGSVLFSWEAAVDAEADPLTYTVYLAGPGFEHTVGGLTEPRLPLDAAVLPPDVPLAWAVVATDGHSVRRSLDRFRLLPPSPTAAEDAPPVMPLQLWNYPNPFRAATTFHLTMPQAAHVEATIYDVTGRAVRRLAEGPRSGGEHHYVWDGLDDSGNAVAPGVYVARILAGTAAQSRVVVRIR